MAKAATKDHSFHVRNHGKVFKDLTALKEGIEEISEEDFQFHIKNGNNDWATWIKDVFEDEKLASAIKKLKSKKGFVKKLEEFGH